MNIVCNVVVKCHKTELVRCVLRDGAIGIKMKVKGVARQGEANEEVERYLSEIFEVSRSKISIILGKSSRKKVIKLDFNEKERAFCLDFLSKFV